jgi:hypothetical protein
MWLKNCNKPLRSGIWGVPSGVTFPWETAGRLSISILLGRVGLVISVDQEHGTGMDHITSTATTHPMTPVFYTAFLVDPN